MPDLLIDNFQYYGIFIMIIQTVSSVNKLTHGTLFYFYSEVLCLGECCEFHFIFVNYLYCYAIKSYY